MKPIILLILVCIIEFLLAPKKEYRYRNIDSLIAAFFVWMVEIISDILISIIYPDLQNVELFFYLVIAIQAIIIIGTKLISKSNDSLVKYGIPPKYTEGFRSSFIGGFYDFDKSTPIVYSKGFVNPLGISVLCSTVILACVFVWQSYTYDLSGNTLLLPYSYAGLLSILVEFAVFCLGESKWENLLKRYRSRKNCTNKREYAKSRYSAVEKYGYIFLKNFIYEPMSINRATKFNWKSDAFKSSIVYYNFSDHSESEYTSQEHNAALESFISLNNLRVNEYYVAAYNLIDRDQNVLIKTPSYVEFEPYLVSMIKLKVAKTQKVVMIVSNDEKKQAIVQKIKGAFNEYFGFDSIPLITEIGEYADIEERKAKQKKAPEPRSARSHLDAIIQSNIIKEEEPVIPIKSPDVVIATSEDVCDPEYIEHIKTIVKNLGLIVYYDFGDSVQEETLFAKIVHAVLDYDDKVPTLYMSDGFFDLEQVVDNFFSKRNLYRIVVPRKPSKESYITGWKSETLAEIQSRTEPDASRNIGNHIPVLYDCTGHTQNDMMIVEDEYDTYAENMSNFSGSNIAHRFDHHVGWTDVIGGNSVICSVSDTYNNAAHTYLAMQGVGEASEYINIISRPYLLRNYLMYHLRYFALNPGVLSSYSPGMIKTSRAISYEAVIKAFITGCTEEQIELYIQQTSLPAIGTPEERLESLVKCALGGKASVAPIITKDSKERYYIDKDTYSCIIEKSGLIEKIEFVNNNQTFLRNRRDYSYLIPHQKIVINGIKYTVEAIKGNRVEITDSNIREPMYITRPVRTCNIRVQEEENYGNIIQNSSDTSISFKRFVCDVSLDVYGTIIFKNSYHPFFDDERFDYQKSSVKQHREYDDVNVFCIKIGSPYINSSNRTEIEHLFALLINEMLPTFFPKHSEKIIIGCNGWVIDPEIGNIMPKTKHMIAQMNIDGMEMLAENEMCIYVLEDSPLETGLVNVFWQDEEFRYMLKVLEDYLYYQETIRRQEQKELFSKNYKEHLHLLRKILLKAANETVEFRSSRDDFDVMNFNSIRASRNKYNNIDISRNFNLTCDICGKPIIRTSSQKVDYHFYSYSGMVSCMNCFSQAVCAEKYSQADINVLEETINRWFMSKYNESVEGGFYNYLEDAEFLNDLVVEHNGDQNRYIVTDDADMDGVYGLSLSKPSVKSSVISSPNAEGIPVTMGDSGVEVYDRVRSGYYVDDNGIPFIFIRDGLPYKKYMGVLCHEMTHQWQYANLDFEKLAIGVPSGRSDEFGKNIDLTSMRIEGHAEWERMRYLSAHGTNTAPLKRKLAATQNSYGIGYVWMKNMMKVGHDDYRIPANRTFKFIMKRNFYQFTKNSFALMKLYFGIKPPDEEN